MEALHVGGPAPGGAVGESRGERGEKGATGIKPAGGRDRGRDTPARVARRRLHEFLQSNVATGLRGGKGGRRLEGSGPVSGLVRI